MGKRKREKEEEKKEGKGSKKRREKKKRKGKRREMKKKKKCETSLLVLKNFPKGFTMPRTLPEALSVKYRILIGSIRAQ